MDLIVLDTVDARKQFARKWAAVHSLDAAVVCAVCEQESGWNPYAMRFEPAFLQHYVKPVDPVAPTTMEISRACSWGLMQVMGLVALELGWRGMYLSDLCDPDRGADFGCRKLKQCFEWAGGQVEKALLHYNGGGNLFYAKQVLARVEKYA